MGKMNIVFPFAVCEDIVKNFEYQLYHVYEASISSERDGTKTNGLLRARVVSSETEKMIEFVISLSHTPVKHRSQRETFHYRIENIRKISDSRSLSQTDTEEYDERGNGNNLTRSRTHSHTKADGSDHTDPADQISDHDCAGTEIENVAGQCEEKVQNKEVAKHQKSASLSETEKETETAAEADTGKTGQLQISSDVSNSDHGYSLVVCGSSERKQVKEAPACPQQIFSNQKKGTKKYDELIRKLKETTETGIAQTVSPQTKSSVHLPHSAVDAHHMLSDSSTSQSVLLECEPPNMTMLQNIIRSSDQKEISSDPKKEDSTTDEAAHQEAHTSTHKRFVRKYDRLIKNLEMASERSGLEMLSVLSGHSYKLDHDARSEQMGSDSVWTADGAPKDCRNGVKEGQKGGCATPSSGLDNSQNSSASKLKSLVDSSLASDKIKSTKAISSKSTVKAAVSLLKPKPAALQTSSHLTSFPRKFPSSLIRTDVLDVFVSHTKTAQSKKRSPASAGLSVGAAVSKRKKSDDAGRLSSTTNESGTKRTEDKTGSAKTLPVRHSQTAPGHRSLHTTLTAPQQCVGVAAISSSAVHSPWGKPGVSAASAVLDPNLQSYSLTGAGRPRRFLLPLTTSAVRHTRQQSEVLVGPFQLLGEGVGPGSGHSSTGPVFVLTAHQPSTAASLRTATPRNGEPPKMDHDYTDLVYDKNAPSSRALKTLVKPISLSQHINARVERVEEGEGSSLVTISGHNRKAAGGRAPPLCYLQPTVLDLTKEGMSIVETLEDALIDTIRCRQKLLESYQLALTAPPCRPVRVAATDIPVVAEMVVTPSRCQATLPRRSLDPRKTAARRHRTKPSLSDHGETDGTHPPDTSVGAAARRHRTKPSLSDHGETDGTHSPDTSVGAARNGRGTGAVCRADELKAEKEGGGTGGVCEERLDQGFIGSRFPPEEEIIVERLSHQGWEQGRILNNQHRATIPHTATDIEKDMMQHDVLVCCENDMMQHNVLVNREKGSTPQAVVMEIDREATLSGQQQQQHHQPAVRRECRYCLRTFQAPAMLYKHVKTVHSAYADSCSHYALYLQGLKRDSQVMCPLCPDPCVLSNTYHLRAHLTNCHNIPPGDLVHSTSAPPPSLCDVCQVHFHTAGELQAHATLLHDREVVGCPHCSLLFVREDTRAKHMSLVHADHTACPYVCPLCHAAFHSRDHLRSHKQAHRRQNSNRITASPPKPRPSRAKWRSYPPRSLNLRCPHCPHMEFSDGAELTTHQRCVHSGPVHCPFCGVGQRGMAAMGGHLKTHLSGGASSLQCPFCQHTVSRRQAPLLLLHLQTQHRHRFPLTCPVCAQRFSGEGPLQVHVSQAHQMMGDNCSGDVSAPGNSSADWEHVDVVCSRASHAAVSPNRAPRVTGQNGPAVMTSQSGLTVMGQSGPGLTGQSGLTVTGQSGPTVMGQSGPAVMTGQSGPGITGQSGPTVMTGQSGPTVMTGQSGLGPVLCGLPTDIQSHVQLMTGQGKQAVVTLHTRDRGLQMVTVTPTHPLPASNLSKPTPRLTSWSATSSLIQTGEECSETGAGSRAVTEALTSSEQSRVGMDTSSQTGTAIDRGDTNITSFKTGTATEQGDTNNTSCAFPATWDVGTVTGLEAEHHSSQLVLHNVDDQSIIVVDYSGALSVPSGDGWKAEVLMESSALQAVLVSQEDTQGEEDPLRSVTQDVSLIGEVTEEVSVVEEVIEELSVIEVTREVKK